MTGFENTVLKLDELPRDDRILTGRIADCKDDDGKVRKYTIGEKLGEGGMGIVYKGIDEQGQIVALKFLKYKESKLVKALKKESKLMSAVEHQNILKVLGFYEDVRLEGDGKEPMPMMVTEYIDGLKALDVANVGKDFCKCLVQIFNGLEAIHGRGLIHRDIKPGNILVTPDGEVKISDFGLSAIIDEHTGLALSMSVSMQDTSQKGIAGTRAYLPKNIEELKNPDKRTDLYSLGLVLYQMILGDASKFPDVRAELRAEKAAEQKKLPLASELAEAVCDLTLEERSERPADIAAIKAKRKKLYTAIEGEAGLPFYWTKLCDSIKDLASRHTTLQYVSKIDEQLKNLDKDKRIEGVVQIIKQLPSALYERTFTDSITGLLDNHGSFFDLRGKPVVGPKNKEDAELVIQAIKYCLENDKQILIDLRMDYLINWENRIREYKSKFGINADETLGILGKVVEDEREIIFNDLLKAIESRGELLCVRAADIKARISTYASRSQLTQDQADKLNALLDKPKNTEAKNEPEDIAAKYIRLAKSLEGKTVTPEFKEAFAMAAYKDGLDAEEDICGLLATLEVLRHKNLVDKVKDWYSDVKISFAYQRDHPHHIRHDVSATYTDLHNKSLGGIVSFKEANEAISKIKKLGKKYNVFVGDLIEKAILEHAFNFPALIRSNPRISLEERFKNAAQLGHKFKVNIGEDIIKEFRKITNDENYITEIKQKYPNAFKETPKFEDLEKMVKGEKEKEKEIEEIVDRTVQTVGNYWEKLKLNVEAGIFVGMTYSMGGIVGILAGTMLDLAAGNMGPGSFYLWGGAASLAAVMGLRAYASKAQAKAIKENKSAGTNLLIDFFAGLSNIELMENINESNKLKETLAKQSAQNDEKNTEQEKLPDIFAEKPTGDYISQKPFVKNIKDKASNLLEQFVQNKISHVVQTRSDIAEVFLPPEQIKAIKGSCSESEKKEQPVQESYKEPIVTEQPKEPEQPKMPVQEMPHSPVQETYKQPEQPTVEKQEEEIEEPEDEDNEDDRMLE